MDLRNSTALASGRLPFDAISFIDRYVQAVTAAIEANAGSITSVAGDGVMSVFGLNGDAAGAARSALAAAGEIWRSIDQLSLDLGDEVGGALRIGIGMRTGVSVVGSVGLPGRQSIQFLGDTGNIASRLESLTKEIACTMIVSPSTVAAGLAEPGWPPANLEIRGLPEPLSVLPHLQSGKPTPEAPHLHINNVNAYHGRLKQWLTCFNGVATKNLPNYLGWRRALEGWGGQLAPQTWFKGAIGNGPYQHLTL